MGFLDWFRAPAPPVEVTTTHTAPESTPEPRRTSHVQDVCNLRVQTRRAGGKLPTGATVNFAYLCDKLKPLAEREDAGKLQTEDSVDFQSLLTDYAPNTLLNFLEMSTPLQRTKENEDAVIEQTSLLLSGAEDLTKRVLKNETIKLETHGRFLDAKFRRSDLDL